MAVDAAIWVLIQVFMLYLFPCFGLLFHSGFAQTFAKEISQVRLPVRYVDGDGRPMVVVEPWPIIDPHNTLSFLMEDAGVHIPTGKLRDFWERSKAYGEPWAQSISSEEMSTTIPIGLYGDSARVNTDFGHEHVLAFFINIVVWRPRSVRWSRFLVCNIPEERLTSATIPALLRRITWSLNHAFYGYFPREGHLGESLEGKALKTAGGLLTTAGYRFQVVELRGDWQFHKKIWRFDRKVHWCGEYVCHLCTAKGISDNWSEVYWNLEENNHVEFDNLQFLVERIPPRNV